MNWVNLKILSVSWVLLGCVITNKRLQVQIILLILNFELTKKLATSTLPPPESIGITAKSYHQ